jgi:hypothetical protein
LKILLYIFFGKIIRPIFIWKYYFNKKNTTLYISGENYKAYFHLIMIIFLSSTLLTIFLPQSWSHYAHPSKRDLYDCTCISQKQNVNRVSFFQHFIPMKPNVYVVKSRKRNKLVSRNNTSYTRVPFPFLTLYMSFYMLN